MRITQLISKPASGTATEMSSAGLSQAAAEPARSADGQGGESRYWDLPCANEEAGQDKLRSAVEWGIHKRFSRLGISGGTLLNLKPCLSEGFFSGPGKTPKKTTLPGEENAAAWLASLPAASQAEIFGVDFLRVMPDSDAALMEIGRVLQEGGQAFLDFHSADHFALAGHLRSLDGLHALEARAAIPPALHTPAQVSAAAESHGLFLSAVIPYSSFYGNSIWIERIGSRYRWERILDWLTSDARLFEFALALEESIVPKLGTFAAPRFMAVLSKGASAGGPLSWAPANTGSQAGPDPEDNRWRSLGESLAGHFSEIRNRVFFHRLWTVVEGLLEEPRLRQWESNLPVSLARTYREWTRQEGMDSACIRAVRGWYQIPEIGRMLRYRGTPLGPGLEYEQYRGMLAEVFGCFQRKPEAGP